MTGKPYRIQSVTLNGVGPFKNVQIDFPEVDAPGCAEVHLFTGGNGSGKSTVLYALAQFFSDTTRFLESQAHKRLHDSNSFVDCCIGGYTAQYNINSKGADRLMPGIFQAFLFSFPIDDRKSFSSAAFAYSGHRSFFDIGRVKSLEEPEDTPFHQVLFSEKNEQNSQTITRWIAISEAKQALFLKKGDRKSADRHAEALAHVIEAVKKISGLDIVFRLELESFRVMLEVNGVETGFDVLPDGLKSILSWVADLLLRLDRIPWENKKKNILHQQFILFLDEIDIHLHPEWQRRILPAVQGLFPNAQIFATTHSPFVVNSVKNAWVYRLDRGEGKIEAIPSGAGKSYMTVLNEVFFLVETFDPETEEKITAFRQVREAVLRGEERWTELKNLALYLSNAGEEVRMIIHRELRQLSRLTGREIDLASE